MSNRPRILLVDSNTDDRALAALLLRRELPDVEIEEVGDGMVLADRLSLGGFAVVVASGPPPAAAGQPLALLPVPQDADQHVAPGAAAAVQELHTYWWGGRFGRRMPREFTTVPVLPLRLGWQLYCCGGQVFDKKTGEDKPFGPLMLAVRSDINGGDGAKRKLGEFLWIYSIVEQRVRELGKWVDCPSIEQADAMFSVGETILLDCKKIHDGAERGANLTWSSAASYGRGDEGFRTLHKGRMKRLSPCASGPGGLDSTRARKRRRQREDTTPPSALDPPA